MNKAKRARNEKEFDAWDEMPDGGRKYWFEVKGKMGGYARYVKYTDAGENTISFIQEIYDNGKNLVSIHEKYPIDKGHKKI